MIDSIAHRGPDGGDVYINKSGTICLAHKRLSIIELERGSQPMADIKGEVWIVFNGVIYNYLELRAELKAMGYPVATYSDTEIIIYSYIEWGKSCLYRFNGMFAFIIYDSRNNQIFGARDRIGIKPVYYYYDKNNIIFASEIKAILKSRIVNPKIDRRGLTDYLTLQYCLKDKTLFKNIQAIIPGHYFEINLNEEQPVVSIKEYWDINIGETGEHIKEECDNEKLIMEKIGFYLKDSIKLRLTADVPIGSYLSGGIDSSVVAALASQILSDTRLQTFTGKFSEDKQFDESFYAKLLAENINAKYNEIDITSENFTDNFEHIVYYMDFPQAGPGVFSQYMVAKLAREKVKVILSGCGGDECFIGYARYLIVYFEYLLKRTIKGDTRFAALKLRDIIKNVDVLYNYKAMMSNYFADGMFEPVEKRYFHIINRLNPIYPFMSKDVFDTNYSCFEEFNSIFNKYKDADLLNKISYYEMKTSLTALLHVEDRISAAANMETRVPLLDHRLVEHAFKIPSHIKLKNGELKYILKRAASDVLPASILERRDKKGFPTPFNRWMKKDLNDWINDILTDKRTRERGLFEKELLDKVVGLSSEYSRTLWGILNLELWFRTFIDNNQKFY